MTDIEEAKQLLLTTWEYFYYPNGSIKIKIPYINNKINGIWREYNKNGSIKRETSFVNGNIHGISREYNKNGSIKLEIFINGVEQWQI